MFNRKDTPKRSFLERLTGVVETDNSHEYDDDPEEGQEYPQDNYNPQQAVAVDSRYGRPVPAPSVAYAPPAHEAEPETVEEDDGLLAIDMYETENELTIQTMVAGVTPEHLNITITRDKVTIRGRRIIPPGVEEDDYHTQELYWGPFSRIIHLPIEIDTEKAEAVEKYGLLVIHLPRVDTGRSAQLKVKSM